MKVIRYSRSFKVQLVREVESGEKCAHQVALKYDAGPHTVLRWVRQLGSGRYGKIIRVEKAQEVNQTARLRSELRRAKEALADTHMELALERAFLTVACEELGQSLEGFKKKHAGVFGPDYRQMVAQDRGFSFGRNVGNGQRLKSPGPGAQRA